MILYMYQGEAGLGCRASLNSSKASLNMPCNRKFSPLLKCSSPFYFQRQSTLFTVLVSIFFNPKPSSFCMTFSISFFTLSTRISYSRWFSQISPLNISSERSFPLRYLPLSLTLTHSMIPFALVLSLGTNLFNSSSYLFMSQPRSPIIRFTLFLIMLVCYQCEKYQMLETFVSISSKGMNCVTPSWVWRDTAMFWSCLHLSPQTKGIFQQLG